MFTAFRLTFKPLKRSHGNNQLHTSHIVKHKLPFLLGPKPGHRLPWSQVLGEKLAPLTVGHTHRMPYLLFVLQIANSNTPR
jgi:hypothetical protein